MERTPFVRLTTEDTASRTLMGRACFIARNLGMYICNHWIAHVPSHTLRNLFYRSVMRYEIGVGSHINMNVMFDSAGPLRIGARSLINSNCHVDTRGGITIGDNVSISTGVTLLTADHDPQDPLFSTRLAPIRVGDHAFIGTGAMVLKGVTIGEGAFVAARSVVVGNVTPYTIVAGNPARKLGDRERHLSYDVSYWSPFH